MHRRLRGNQAQWRVYSNCRNSCLICGGIVPSFLRKRERVERGLTDITFGIVYIGGFHGSMPCFVA